MPPMSPDPLPPAAFASGAWTGLRVLDGEEAAPAQRHRRGPGV